MDGIAMTSADRKAALEWANHPDTYRDSPRDRNLARTYIEVCAELEQHQAITKDMLRIILGLPQRQFEKFRSVIAKHRDLTLPIEKELEGVEPNNSLPRTAADKQGEKE
jgi:hypothetical protein